MFSCTWEQEPGGHELCKTRSYLSEIMKEDLFPYDGEVASPPTTPAKQPSGEPENIYTSLSVWCNRDSIVVNYKTDIYCNCPNLWLPCASFLSEAR